MIDGAPLIYLRRRGHLLVSASSSHTSSAQATMATSGRSGFSSSVAISAAIEPMVMPLT